MVDQPPLDLVGRGVLLALGLDWQLAGRQLGRTCGLLAS